MNITRQRWKRFFVPQTVLFGLATGLAIATPAEAITINGADDVGSSANGNVPTNTQAISEANSFAGGSYSSLTVFDLSDVVVTPTSSTSGPDEGVVTGSDSSSNVSTGFNVDLDSSQYTQEGELLRINPQTSGTTVTFDLSTPATKFGLFISDYGNASGTSPISYQLLDSSDVVINSGDIPIAVPNTTIGEASSISGQSTRSIVFWGATAESGDNPISSVVLNTDVSGTDRFAIDEVRVQPVPFEAETGAGLVVLGSYLGWKRLRRRKQVSLSES